MKSRKPYLEWVVIVAAILSMAPDDKPEKIDLTSANYDSGTSSFELRFASSFGIATAGEHADFEISTTLVIETSSGDVVTLGPQSDLVQRLDGRDDARNEPVQLEPQHIVWPGPVAGTAVVTATSQLMRDGQAIGGEVQRTATLEIRGP